MDVIASQLGDGAVLLADIAPSPGCDDTAKHRASPDTQEHFEMLKRHFPFPGICHVIPETKNRAITLKQLVYIVDIVEQHCTEGWWDDAPDCYSATAGRALTMHGQ